MEDTLFNLKDVCFSFPKEESPLFESININIKSHALVKINGESGSGKSTLLKILARFHTISRGQILYQNQSIYDYPLTTYRQNVSYFFQNVHLFGQTVRDNLSFPADIRQEPFDKQRAVQWLERVHLDISYLDRPIDELSGGEKQRIGFIRNLQYLPKVLLLDEVTSALDHENRAIIAQIIKDLNRKKGITVLSVSHFDEGHLSFDQTLEIAEGKVYEVYV